MLVVKQRGCVLLTLLDDQAAMGFKGEEPGLEPSDGVILLRNLFGLEIAFYLPYLYSCHFSIPSNHPEIHFFLLTGICRSL